MKGLKMLHNEYVLETKQSTTIKAILVDGISVYSKKTKDEFIQEGCLVFNKNEAFDLIYTNENTQYIKEWEEITESKWWEALEMLPPLRHLSLEGHTFFFCCEAYTGNIHSCYCSTRGKYFKAMRRLTTSYEEMIKEIKGL